jgi:two-component system cell cycle sensor histidine kinase/response regulator CckA
MEEITTQRARVTELEDRLSKQPVDEEALTESDMNERRQSGEALKASEARYRRLFETAKDGILILDANTGKIFDSNLFIEDMLGYSHTELVGRTLWEIGPFRDIAASKTAFQELQSKEYIRYENLELQTKNGEHRYVEFVSNVYTVDDTKFIQCNIRDITERMQWGEKIREQAELLNKAQDAIIVRDLADRILFCNERTLRLYAMDGVVDEPGGLNGKTINDILYHGDSSQFEKAKRTTLEKGEWNGELLQTSKDGKEVIVESRWSLIRDNMGKPKSIFTINTDITAKKRLEAQFLRAQRMESIGTLAGGIAHDLNNVLHPITMALQLLRKRFTDEKSQSWLDTLETSAQRGANLVKQVLSFARGVEGEHNILQIRHMIIEIEKILGETFPKSIEVHTDIPKDLWTVSGDPTQLHQVLMNLCVNAHDAISGSGRLSISAENIFIDENYARMNIDAKVGPYIVITVSDTGGGIPPRIMDRIFEPFFTTKEPGKGTGLGLSTAIGIVRSHGGFINVYSEVGRGTRFRVYLPAIETTEVKRAGEKIGELLRGHGELILVVDDEASIREVTRAILETHGYRVITANDGAEAVALYAQHREELGAVLMDMVMPIMDGPSAIRALYKINPQVKVIAVSGITKNDKLEVAGVDVCAFLAKPYTGETLLKTLHDVLSTS